MIVEIMIEKEIFSERKELIRLTKEANEITFKHFFIYAFNHFH